MHDLSCIVYVLQLLAKAGYKGSGGLGAAEQGITTPLPAWHNQGRMGIGSAPSQSAAQSATVASKAGNLSASEVKHGSQQSQEAMQQGRTRSKAPGKAWERVSTEADKQVIRPS